MAGIDPNDEWLGYVQPVGLVVAPIVLARYGLTPEIQTRADTEAARAFIAPKPDDGKAADPRALRDPWAFFAGLIGWRVAQVAGAPGGPALPEDLFLKVEESDTEIAPDWAVADPDGRWQMLVRIEPPGVKPDERAALKGWEATPHQRFERLLREKQIPIGLLISDDELRLIYAPRGETSGWLSFPIRSLAEVGGRPMLGGLKLLLSSFRLHNDAPERRLPALLKASREAQAEVSTRLAAQVLGALHELLRGLHAADRERIERLARDAPEHLYDGLLVVLLRLVFLLYAEDRDLIPSRTDAEARAFYAQGYGVRSLYAQLLDDRAKHPDTMDERRGAWGRLLALFSLVHHGDRTGWVRGRGGKLFDPAVYPFLQGREQPGEPPAPAHVSDGSILRILDALITVDGEKLSYRTLDVEQIGSVYETVMGFAVETRAGPAVAIKAGKNDRTPVFVDLAALVAVKGAERQKFLKEEAGRNALPDRVAKALSAVKGSGEALEALRAIVDERGSPGGHPSLPGTPLLQPTDERRRTGSHYTPRSLTQPIVEHALEPAFERIGPDARPEDVLALKVCDPAMGSGAFLVEACRALGERLVSAWRRWPETRPKIPDDEDEPLHARRLVAQRCLYGVDKNPRAVELAKLSLWLATLARDHEFTFLDHALKSGDSLVGLDGKQIAAMHWDLSKPGLPLFRKFVADRVAEATKARAEIQSAPDDTARAILEAKHRAIEVVVADVRTLGDAVLSAFFAEEKPKAREKQRSTIESWVAASPVKWDDLRAAATSLCSGEHPQVPFHWQIEFPEVFGREIPGFDAIVGNPPFMGGTVVSASMGMPYFRWLATSFAGAYHLCDLVAYFFRRAFQLLRQGGSLGLLATNSICQGDTREGGLEIILKQGGNINHAVRRLPWPGEAAVVVSMIHILKGEIDNKPTLNGKFVSRISAFLIEGRVDGSPRRLKEAPYYSLGSKIYGQGFLFDDTDLKANEVSVKDKLVKQQPELSSRIIPYVGGEDINNDATVTIRRWAIFLSDLQSEQDFYREAGPLAELVDQKVKPERMKLGNNPNNVPLKRRWWAYQANRPELYRQLGKSRFAIHV
jgi:N-6 DNA Methylase